MTRIKFVVCRGDAPARELTEAERLALAVGLTKWANSKGLQVLDLQVKEARYGKTQDRSS